MPKTTSEPTASSARTSDCAPVTRTGVPAGGAGFGRAPPAAGPFGWADFGDPPWASWAPASPAEPDSDRDVALVMDSASCPECGPAEFFPVSRSGERRVRKDCDLIRS